MISVMYLKKFYYEQLCFRCSAVLPVDASQSLRCGAVSETARMCSLFCLNRTKKSGKDIAEFEKLEIAVRDALAGRNLKAHKKMLQAFPYLIKNTSSIYVLVQLAMSEFAIALYQSNCKYIPEEIFGQCLHSVGEFMWRTWRFAWAEDVFTYMYTIYETCGEDKQPIALKLAEIKEVQFKAQEALHLLQTIDMSKEKKIVAQKAFCLKLSSLCRLEKRAAALALYNIRYNVFDVSVVPKTDKELNDAIWCWTRIVWSGALLGVDYENSLRDVGTLWACLHFGGDNSSIISEKFNALFVLFQFMLSVGENDFLHQIMELFGVVSLSKNQPSMIGNILYNYCRGMYEEAAEHFETAIDYYMFSVAESKHFYGCSLPFYGYLLQALERCCSKSAPVSVLLFDGCNDEGEEVD